MKIIDLLNKIANGEEVPSKIEYRNKIFIYDKDNQCYVVENYNEYYDLHMSLSNHKGTDLLYEVEILEEKKIPEKLTYYSMEKIQKAKNKDEWREERITLLEKRVEDLHIKMNDLLDYLKSKGDE